MDSKKATNDISLKKFGPHLSVASRFAIAFTACSLVLSLYLFYKSPKLRLTFEMSSSTSSTAQLFYDTGAGFSEAQSDRLPVSVQAQGRFQNFDFALPKLKIVHLRLDPTTVAATVVIKNAAVTSSEGWMQRIPPSDLLPYNQIRVRTQQGSQVTFSTDPAANDPGIVLELHQPLNGPHAFDRSRIRSLALADAILLLCTVLAFSLKTSILRFVWFVKKGLQKVNRRFQAIASRLSESNLILIDSYAIWFYLLCGITFCSTSVADLNGSSIAIYNEAYGNGAPEHAWIGAPRGTRSDEWAYATPDILHQSLRLDRFEVRNSARGGHSVALIDSVPVKHFSTLFRPQFWAFFVMPVDYAYAFFWQFKGLILITGVFTWLLFLTRSTFWSITGSLWFFFSPSTQWSYSWSTGLPEMIGLTCLLMVSICIMAVAKNRIVLALAALVTTSFSIDLALSAYLPHLLPLFWLGATFIISWFISNRKLVFRRQEAGRRFLAIVASGLLIAVVGALVFSDVRGAITGIANTEYPGKRVFAGASEKLVVLTGHFLQWTEPEAPLPTVLNNISEASGFLWLAPVTVFALGRTSLRKSQKFALGALWLTFSLILVWLLLPVSPGIARVLGLNRTGVARCVPALGLVNIAIVVLCMSAVRSQRETDKGCLPGILGRGLAIWLIFFVILQLTNDLLGSYFSTLTVCLDAAFAAVLSLLILESRGETLAIILVFSNMLAFGAVNPVERGLGVVTHSALYKLVHTKRELLNGKWLVFSDSFVPSGFLEAVGCDTYTGMRFLPDIDRLPLLASRGMNTRVFNNATYLIAEPLNLARKSDFESLSTAVTRWHVSPLDPILKTIGIKYLAFDQRPSITVSSRLLPIDDDRPVDKLWLYQIP